MISRFFKRFFIFLVGCSVTVSSYGQTPSLETLRNGWVKYEKKADRFYYEKEDLKDGVLNHRSKVGRKGNNLLSRARFVDSDKETIHGVNEKYHFKLTKPIHQNQYHLESAATKEEYLTLPVELFRYTTLLVPPSLKFYLNLNLLDVFADDAASVSDIRLSEDGQQVIVHFELEKPVEIDVNEIRLKKGVLTLGKAPYFLPERIEYVPSTGGDPNENMISVVEDRQYSDIESLPSLTRQTLTFSNGLVLENHWKPLEEPLSNSDFRLSAYDLPEPSFLKSPSPFRWLWIVLAAVILCSALVGVKAAVFRKTN